MEASPRTIPSTLCDPEKIDGPKIDAHATRILDQASGTLREIANAPAAPVEGIRGSILDRVFRDQTLIDLLGKAKIRLASMRAKVARKIAELIGHSPDMVQDMTMGNVVVPETVFPGLTSIYKRALAYLDPKSPEFYGYELLSQGDPNAREAAIIGEFDRSYGFLEISGLVDKLKENMTLTNGGMNALAIIVRALTKSVRTKDKDLDVKGRRKHRVIHADSRYDTWAKMCESESDHGERIKIHTIGTTQENFHHLTPELVQTFYDGNEVQGDGSNDTWYITPVGNPTGTVMTPEQLLQTCQAIVQRNPNATIVLDCVYVRILRPERAKALMWGIVHDPKVLSRIIFVESLSKSHGFCRQRAGCLFTENKAQYGPHLAEDALVSAGHGEMVSALFLSVANSTAEERAKVEGLHDHWTTKRDELYRLMMSEKYRHLFANEQHHIRPEDLKEPISLYLFLQLADDVTAEQVETETGYAGFETEMGGDEGPKTKYIRFSVGVEPKKRKEHKEYEDFMHRDPWEGIGE